MSNSAVRFNSYNRLNKIIVKSALADILEEQNFDLQEEKKENLQRINSEEDLIGKICGLAVKLGADEEEIDELFDEYCFVEVYDIEASVDYWGDYFKGQPLADKIHSGEVFESMSNTTRRIVGQALNILCDLPVGWVQHCIYARTRGIELGHPTIGWRFTREDVEAA